MEVGYLNSQQDNDIGDISKAVTSRWLFNAKAYSNFGDESIYGFTLTGSLRNYSFYQNEASNSAQQRIVMASLANTFKTRDGKNKLSISGKYAKMAGENSESENFIISARASKIFDKFSVYMMAHNLLDSRRFSTVSIFPSYRLSSDNYMLGRFFQAGISFQFK